MLKHHWHSKELRRKAPSINQANLIEKQSNQWEGAEEEVEISFMDTTSNPIWEGWRQRVIENGAGK